jgi:hypothetical protein
MKKLYAFALFLALGSMMFVSAQDLNNSGLENWGNVGTDTEEPDDWNSFKTAGGALAMFAAKQIQRSTVIRPGSAGQYSALIWSRETMSIVANGNVTTGKINMGNVNPSDPSNYNECITTDPLFSETFTAIPDSFVFWAKFVPASGSTSDSARLRAVIHDNYNYRDPNTSDPNAASHIVAAATHHFVKTDGAWVRFAVPFIETGPASTPEFMLVTFTTNKNPGGGTGGDSLYIDDIEMIYNSISITETPGVENCNAYVTGEQLVVDMRFDVVCATTISLYTMVGQQVLQTRKDIAIATEQFDLSAIESGVYILNITRADGQQFSRKVFVK